MHKSNGMKIVQYKTMNNAEGLPELVSVMEASYDGDRLFNPESIVGMMNGVFQAGAQAEEYVYEVCFNSKGKPVGVFEVAHGTVKCAYFDTREVYQKALMCGAVSIILVHNHPSGDPSPSKADRDVAATFSEAGRMIGVHMADSIIVGGGSYFSFNEAGLLA